MGRTVLRHSEPTRNRRKLGAPVLAGIALILLFALLGVVSAGAWVAGQLSGGTKTSQPATHQVPPASVVAQDVTRAQAEATAIVREAQSAGHAIMSSATARANKRARAIVASARHRAASITAAAAARGQASARPAESSGSSSSGTTGGGVAGSTTAPVTSAGSTSSTGVYGSGTSTTSGSGNVAGTSTGLYGRGALGVTSGAYGSGAAGVTSGTTGQRANLSGLPASWRVVGYNASFGAGPGSAGSITVTNRGFKTYSGAVRVVYAGGGAARATFSGLAPGQSAVLPLNGPAYRGGGYQILVNVP